MTGTEAWCRWYIAQACCLWMYAHGFGRPDFVEMQRAMGLDISAQSTCDVHNENDHVCGDSVMFPRYPEETQEAWETRACKEVLYALEELIDLFGYETVYFRVGVEAFPDAVNPWEEPDMY